MKVINNGKSIVVEADYIDMATIVQVLDDYCKVNDDKYVKELAYQLHNPKVVTGK